MLEKYKTNCSRHKIVEMAKFLGVNANTLDQKIRRAKMTITNTSKDPKLCHFCENKLSPNISQNTRHRKMAVIISLIKDLSIYEKTNEIKMLCQIAVKMLYQKESKRRLSLFFKTLGENPEDFVNSFLNFTLSSKGDTG